MEESQTRAIPQNPDEIQFVDPFSPENPYELSPQELRILRYWKDGAQKQEAYKRVMLSDWDQKALTKEAIIKRTNRLFDTYRMRLAMASCPGERGEKARKSFEKWRETHDSKVIKNLVGKDGFKRKQLINTYKEEMECQKEMMKKEFDEQYKQKLVEDRQEWLMSLNVNVEPSSLTIYGTGQFLVNVAVDEIRKRRKAIKEREVDVLSTDGSGSALTPTIISALKTAAAMILPFAPAPSAEDRKQMSKAAVLLGLMPETIQEDPDDYTAPIPATIDVGDKE